MVDKIKPAGLREVAEASGVSMMTASRALRGLEGVSAAKRQQILTVADGLNYVPNRNARSLAVTNSDLIGVSLPTLFNDVFADILDSMRDVFRKAGYAIVVETTEYDSQAEQAWVERLLSWRPAAVVLTGHDHLGRTKTLLRNSAVPVLEIWDVGPDPIDIGIGLDHVAAGRMLGAYGAGLGYRRPAYVGAAEGFDPRAEARFRGLVEAFAPTCPAASWIVARVEERNPFVAGEIGLAAALGQGAPDIVFFLNDHFAVGGLMHCQKQRIAVPDDLGLAGFNALRIASVVTPDLTTLASPRREIGGRGARRLVARLRGVDTRGTEVLDARLVPGGTTRPQGV
ncbi:MAG: LacI family DNA-binding transcriptional regulator [Pseudomonadota bacterium]